MSLRRGPLVNTCGREDCDSSCHRPELRTGRYCAPLRCYCGGCPAHVPVDRTGRPVTVAELAERAAALEALERARRAAAVPIGEAPAIVAELRTQLGQLTEEHVGPALHRAWREKASRSS